MVVVEVDQFALFSSVVLEFVFEHLAFGPGEFQFLSAGLQVPLQLGTVIEGHQTFVRELCERELNEWGFISYISFI